MDLISLVFIFILGTLIGSFLHVVASRYNTGSSPLAGRSVCTACNRTLRWYELVPLVSFLFLHGRCRTCGTKLSWQYPVVEFLTGIAFILIALRQFSLWPTYSMFQHGLLYSVLFFVYYAVVFSILIIIGVYDMRHKIIPNGLVYAFILLAIAKLALFFVCTGFNLTLQNTLDLLAPILLFLPFALLWLLSSGKWIGFGDAKLALGIGALLGFVSGVSAIVIGFWLGALWSIGMLVCKRFSPQNPEAVTLHSEVPFAPFLILGTIIVFFTRIDVFSLGPLLSFFQ